MRVLRHATLWLPVPIAPHLVGDIRVEVVSKSELHVGVKVVLLPPTGEDRAGEYTPTEQSCTGCMGPCGRCHEPRLDVNGTVIDDNT